MGFLTTRVAAVSIYLSERIRHGLPESVGTVSDEVLFVLDGVGGFQFVPLLVRKALRQIGSPMPTVFYDWQFGLTGEIWTDLMWLRRNRLMGAKFARKLLAFRSRNPGVRLHILASSGGAGIAVFGCEVLGRSWDRRSSRRKLAGKAGESVRPIDTLILACPALSPTYDLDPALRTVNRCYALVSHRDRWILGLGTTLFGTTDRQFGRAAGMVGFQLPSNAASDRSAYERLREVRWTPEMRRWGCRGGHTSWAGLAFMRQHLLPLLRGEPALDTHTVGQATAKDKYGLGPSAR